MDQTTVELRIDVATATNAAHVTVSSGQHGGHFDFIHLNWAVVSEVQSSLFTCLLDTSR